MKRTAILSCMYSSFAWADKAPGVGGQMSGPEWFRMLAGLGFVLLVIFLLSWLLKKLQTSGFSVNSSMKIITGMSLGGREKLMLIEAEGRYLLVGVAQGGVSLIYDFGTEKPNSLDGVKKSSFASILSSVKGAQK